MMHFDLADLRLYVSVAEAGTLTQGARNVFLSAAYRSLGELGYDH